MKTIIMIILITISIFASQNDARKIPEYVIGAKSMGLIKAKDAFFIIGSRKYGIMKDTFAFSSKKNAEEYIKKTGGCVVDYNTYIKMDDKEVEKYVKEHGIVIVKDTNTTKPIKKSKPASGIYSKENMKKYR